MNLVILLPTDVALPVWHVGPTDNRLPTAYHYTVVLIPTDSKNLPTLFHPLSIKRFLVAIIK